MKRQPYALTAWASRPGVVVCHENLPDWARGLMDLAYACESLDEWISLVILGWGVLRKYQIVHPGAEERLDWRPEVESYCLSGKRANSRGRCPRRCIAARIFPQRFGCDLDWKDAFDVGRIIEGHSLSTTCPSWVRNAPHVLATRGTAERAFDRSAPRSSEI
jgi:hypothetical protein